MATCFLTAATTWDHDPHTFPSRACVDGVARATCFPTWVTKSDEEATCLPREPASLGSLPHVAAIQGRRVGQRGPVVYLVIPLRQDRNAYVFPSQG
jgi:hypothetical protein